MRWALDQSPIGTLGQSRTVNSQHKSIFEYENYRTYLQDQFALLKQENPKFSHRYFAKLAGLRSSSFMLSVMQDKANLSVATIESVAKALSLNKDETFYFRNLVLFNQATTVDERLLYAQQVLKSKSFRRAHPLAESTYRYFSHWYYVAIKELAGLPDFSEKPDWIVKRLANQISPDQVKTALEELAKLGVLSRNTEGQLKPVEDIIVTPDEVTSAFVVKYHEELIKLGAECIRKYPREQREISGTTFKVSKNSLPKIKDILQRFRKEIVESLAEESDPEALYQLNIQLFPLAPFKNNSDW